VVGISVVTTVVTEPPDDPPVVGLAVPELPDPVELPVVEFEKTVMYLISKYASSKVEGSGTTSVHCPATAEQVAFQSSTAKLPHTSISRIIVWGPKNLVVSQVELG